MKKVPTLTEQNTSPLSLTFSSLSNTFVLPYFLDEQYRAGEIDEQIVKVLEMLSALTEFSQNLGGKLVGVVDFQPAYDSGEQIPLLTPSDSLLFSKRISVNSPEDILGIEADHAEFVRWYSEYRALAAAEGMFGILLMRVYEQDYTDESQALVTAEWHLLGGRLVLTKQTLYEN